MGSDDCLQVGVHFIRELLGAKVLLDGNHRTHHYAEQNSRDIVTPSEHEPTAGLKAANSRFPRMEDAAQQSSRHSERSKR
jgi:hypothetical protein